MEENDNEFFSLKDVDPELYEKLIKAVEDLEINGYAVIPTIINKKRIEEYKSMMWDTLESASSQYESFKFDRNIQSYDDYKMDALFPHKHGILESYRINHCQAARNARKEEKILQIFATMYGDTRLVCSLDRINFKFPGKPYKSQNDWPHVDQNPRKLGRRCIQAYLNITGTNNDKEPGNRFYEKSHKAFKNFTKPYRGLDDTDWFKLTDDMINTIPEKYNLKLVKPLCPPGSLVLWDSRTIHSPHDGSDFGIGRCVFYMCYLPYQLSTFTKSEEIKKSNAFTTMRSTQHTPYPQHMFPKTGRTYGKSKEDIRYLEIDPVHLFAHTLKKYESNEEKEKALDKCLLPDKEEELLFGFKSYSSLPSNIGLWGKKIKGKPLIKLTPMSEEWLPLSKDVIKRRKEEKEKKKKETAKKKSDNKVIRVNNRNSGNTKNDEIVTKKRKIV